MPGAGTTSKGLSCVPNTICRPLPALRMQIGVGTLMEDVHRLHLPSLTWRGPLPLHPDSGAVRRTAGHSATGLVSRCARV